MERTYKILITFVVFIGCIEASWSLSFHLLQYPSAGTGDPRNCGIVEIDPTERNNEGPYEVLQNAARKNCEVPPVIKFIYASRCTNGYGMTSYTDIPSNAQNRDAVIMKLKADSKGFVDLYIVE